MCSVSMGTPFGLSLAPRLFSKCVEASASDGNQSISISRQSFSVHAITAAGSERYTHSGVTFDKPELQSEPREKLFTPHTRNKLSGSQAEFNAVSSVLIRGALQVIPQLHLSFSEREINSPQDMSEVIGAYTNRQRGVRSRQLHSLAQGLIVWGSTWFLSLRATHVPGIMNRAADLLSRGNPMYREWTLHPQVVSQLWLRYSQAAVDLFA